MQDSETVPQEPRKVRRAPSSLGLPTDLFIQARQRVQAVAAVVTFGAGLDILQFLIGVVFLGDQPGAVADLAPFAANCVTCLLSLAIILLARNRRVPDTRLIDLTLTYEVFLCAIISTFNPASTYADIGTLPNLTWVTPIIILFPLLVPARPGRMLVTAILAASTRPLALLLHGQLGTFPVTGGDLARSVFSPMVAVVMAYYGSRVIYGMGVQVARARQAGSYELVELLGKGGMGEVWLAHHRLLARPAAVKLVTRDVVRDGDARRTDTVLKRFEREAQATAALRSPHTIGLYDFGVTEEGAFYYVMELLDGLDADSLVRTYGPLPVERVLFLLKQACHSLAEAHERGLVHRDVKPANLFVCRYGREVDFVKVLDFGLVQGAAGSGPEEIQLTAEGSVGGTPAFMPPEQALGRETDARSDLYALGCVAYWMLTGRIPFEGANAMDVAMHHVRTAPTPPSAATELDIPASVDRLVLDCLAKEPDDRPPTAIALLRRLEECQPESAWTEERARRWWEVNRPETAPSA